MNNSFKFSNSISSTRRPREPLSALQWGIIFVAIAALSVAAFLVASAHARQTYGPYHAYVARVIDGDTFAAEILSFPGDIKTFNVRVDGIDTPEIRGKCQYEKDLALKAKAFATKFLGQTVILSDVRFGKFAGRVIATVKDSEGRLLSEALLSNGLARIYKGRKRGSWCNG